MTAREKKAVEIMRADYPNGTKDLTDNEVIIRFDYDVKKFLEAMQWQADRCALEQRLLSPFRSDITEGELMDEARDQYKYILNAGTEQL